MSRLSTYAFKAVQSDGKTRSGHMMAASEAEVFAKLRADNLSPVSIRAKLEKTTSAFTLPKWLSLNAQLPILELEELLQSLAVLLRAGADIRTALGVLSADSEAIREVSQKILGGSTVDMALSTIIPPSLAHLRGLIAAGEARGDLASGLDSAARVLATRRKIRQQLVEALSYPAFVLVSAIAALSVILLVVVPAIAPLLQDTGKMPVYFEVVLGVSNALQVAWPFLLAAVPIAGLLIYISWRYGGLKAGLDIWLIDGPLKGIVRPLVFGGYAKTLGETLDAGATLGDALRLSQRGVANGEARKRLDGVVTHIRQGRALSEGLRNVTGFPKPIIRLCEVGEAASALGTMLARAGEREETIALGRIDKYSKVLGPLLIVVLGAMIGMLMAGVLSALSDIGNVAGA